MANQQAKYNAPPKQSSAIAARVGEDFPRVDGVSKVTGSAKYIDDISPEDIGVNTLWHGATVRSNAVHGAHSRLVSLRPSKDFDWSGLTVVTAEDLSDCHNYIMLMEKDQPALVPVGGIISHPDEPLALVAGADRNRVLEAINHFDIQTKKLPAVLDITAAKLQGESHLFKTYALHHGGDVDEVFALAPHVIEGVYKTGAQEQMYIEPQGVIAWWDKGHISVLGSLQCPYYIQAALKSFYSIDDDHINVRQATTGGGFGGKEEYPSILSVHASLLARKTGQAVKIIYHRAEDIAATTKRHPCEVKHRVAVDDEGKILAVDIEVDLDCGAYVTLSTVVLSRAVLHAAGPYNCPHARIVGRGWRTHKSPFGAFRGFGAPQVTFAYERQMAKVAQHLNMEAFALRRINMLNDGDETVTGQRLNGSVASAEVLLKTEEALPSLASSHLGSPIRYGRGLAFYYHGAGFTGSGEARLQAKVGVRFNTQYNKFEVLSSSADIGQGSFTSFAQMAATALQVDGDAVMVATPETARVPDSGPTVASRTCMVVGAVVMEAAELLRKKLLDFSVTSNASEHVSSSKAVVSSEYLLDLAAAYAKEHGECSQYTTYKMPPDIYFDDDTYRGDAYPAFGWAACVVDVAVDLDTFEVTVQNVVHAVDVGKAINPIIVKGQIEGGTMQSLGWALWEHVIYKEGQVQNTALSNSIIPTCKDAPNIDTIIVEEPFIHGPCGAKGVGEIPMDGPVVATVNAIEDALLGMLKEHRPDCVPLLPEMIAQLVNGKEAKSWL